MGKLILIANIEPSWQEEGGQLHHQQHDRQSRKEGRGGGQGEGRQARFFGWSERA